MTSQKKLHNFEEPMPDAGAMAKDKMYEKRVSLSCLNKYLKLVTLLNNSCSLKQPQAAFYPTLIIHFPICKLERRRFEQHRSFNFFIHGGKINWKHQCHSTGYRPGNSQFIQQCVLCCTGKEETNWYQL
jgi:hypothetical protein